MSPEELCDRATQKVMALGPLPENARDAARWRDRRESAIVDVATLADWEPALLRKAALLCVERRDDPTGNLLFEASDYCPNSGPGRRR
jgi:hypothetical protein